MNASITITCLIHVPITVFGGPFTIVRIEIAVELLLKHRALYNAETTISVLVLVLLAAAPAASVAAASFVAISHDSRPTVDVYHARQDEEAMEFSALAKAFGRSDEVCRCILKSEILKASHGGAPERLQRLCFFSCLAALFHSVLANKLEPEASQPLPFTPEISAVPRII